MNATQRLLSTLLLAASLGSIAHANTINGEQIDVPIDALKRGYLACDHAAMNSRLTSGAIAQCSIIYEELKRRAFGGDFEKLTEWANSQQPAQNTASR